MYKLGEYSHINKVMFSLSAPYPFPFPSVLLSTRVLTRRAYNRPFHSHHVDSQMLALAIQRSKQQCFYFSEGRSLLAMRSLVGDPLPLARVLLSFRSNL